MVPFSKIMYVPDNSFGGLHDDDLAVEAVLVGVGIIKGRFAQLTSTIVAPSKDTSGVAHGQAEVPGGRDLHDHVVLEATD